MTNSKPKTEKRLRAGFKIRHKKGFIRVYVSRNSPLGKACMNRDCYENMKLEFIGPLYDRFSFRQRDKELYVVWLRPFRRLDRLDIFAEFNLKHRDRLLSSFAGKLAHDVWASVDLYATKSQRLSYRNGYSGQ